jgi:hypothetical protein
MLETNLTSVQQRIVLACSAADRDPSEVKLLLATKRVPAEQVAEAIRLGATLVGENRVQELAEKDAVLGQLDCERHFIGRLQSNKVNQVLRYVSCVQSLDRLELADRLQRRLETLDDTIDVLVQVNTSNEASKGGIPPEDALSFTHELTKRDRLQIKGLMTIGPLSDDEGHVRTSYRTLRKIRDNIADKGVTVDVISMGMSGDLEAAIAEGSTMVRVGSSVFGPRSR